MSGDRTGGDAVDNRIALLRAEQGVTRRELADALGAHYETVGYLERGEYDPSLHLALRIAGFSGLPVEVVFSTRPSPRISDAGTPGSARCRRVGEQARYGRGPAAPSSSGSGVRPTV